MQSLSILRLRFKIQLLLEVARRGCHLKLTYNALTGDVASERFRYPAPTVYRSPRFIRPAHLEPESQLAWHSKQYVKALRVSFPPDRWPATELADSDGTVRVVLKDGTEIHRIGPPSIINDYATGEPIGKLGPKCNSCSPKRVSEVLILDL